MTFRLYAPDATDVRVSGNWPDDANVAMTKDARGVWAATIGPLKPEFWSYRFVVNGRRGDVIAMPALAKR